MSSFRDPQTTAVYWLIDLKLVHFWSKQLFLDLLIKTPVSIWLTPVQIPLRKMTKVCYRHQMAKQKGPPQKIGKDCPFRILKIFPFFVWISCEKTCFLWIESLCEHAENRNAKKYKFRKLSKINRKKALISWWKKSQNLPKNLKIQVFVFSSFDSYR